MADDAESLVGRSRPCQRRRARRLALCGSVSCRERTTQATSGGRSSEPTAGSVLRRRARWISFCPNQWFGARRSARGPALCGSVSCRERLRQRESGGRSSEPTARPSVLHRRSAWLCLGTTGSSRVSALPRRRASPRRNGVRPLFPRSSCPRSSPSRTWSRAARPRMPRRRSPRPRGSCRERSS